MSFGAAAEGLAQERPPSIAVTDPEVEGGVKVPEKGFAAESLRRREEKLSTERLPWEVGRQEVHD